jgi:hypothetical protein
MIFHVSLEKAEDGWIVAQCPAPHTPVLRVRV